MRRLVLAATAIAVFSQVTVAGAGATTSSEILSYVNALRVANKIPAAITEATRWSAACAAHNHYEALNGGLNHVEAPGNPGYTADGAMAGRRSVLYTGSLWTAASTPFDNAPLHMAQVLAPRLNRAGAAESEGFGCLTTLMGRDRRAPSKKKIYTYPTSGTTGWRTSELAREAPYTPGQRRGIPEGTTTGPYLLVMFDGPTLAVGSEAKVSSASLKGPGGAAVSIVVADNRTSGLKGYLPTGAYLIPRNPLAPNTKYTARVSASIAGHPRLKFVHTWSFTTGR